MQSSQIPALIGVPFAINAQPTLVRDIPEASQAGVAGHQGWASFNDGFPIDNFTAVDAGGIPPFGQDMNGLMKHVTSWLRWVDAGGPIPWNQAFSTKIGGYPKGAVVRSASSTANPGFTWLSLIENNQSNPDSGGGGWFGFDLGIARVQDGGGVAQLSNVITKLGWDGSRGRLTFNGADWGQIANYQDVANEAQTRFNTDSSLSDQITNVYNALNAAKQNNLGFTPVRQSGGNLQATNTVYLGYSPQTGMPRIQIDGNDFGNIWTEARNNYGFGGLGYHRFPNGFMLQWGTYNSYNGGHYAGYSFPTSFNQTCLACVVSEANSVGWEQNTAPTIYGAGSYSAGGFALNAMRWNGSSFSFTDGITFNFIAVGG